MRTKPYINLNISQYNVHILYFVYLIICIYLPIKTLALYTTTICCYFYLHIHIVHFDLEEQDIRYLVVFIFSYLFNNFRFARASLRFLPGFFFSLFIFFHSAVFRRDFYNSTSTPPTLLARSDLIIFRASPKNENSINECFEFHFFVFISVFIILSHPDSLLYSYNIKKSCSRNRIKYLFFFFGMLTKVFR